ncbi:hypothetical protein NC653_028812 [Populus alba x Populus x berolinensis]|uniref:Uncharacterized protein n=1 Tax=Populus alba x Populus x berolinensis TaxID=444605 RepID=A0AAD6M0N2_9ROSI|nr:hypothetical protein NC653_028812 [Populus alba x Populus x berolinensis]
MPRNYFSCETGDCGSGNISCQAHRPTYPVTLLISFDIKQNVVSDVEPVWLCSCGCILIKTWFVVVW